MRELGMATCSEIIQQIEQQWTDLLRVRSAFPTMRDNVLGAQHIATAPFYQHYGYHVRLSFAQPLTPETIEEVNQIGRWLNESYVIRLCALLEFYQIIPREGQGRINQSLEGHEAVDILRRLRNALLHRSGRHNPEDADSCKLYERMVQTFSIQSESSTTATQYPVHIDGFLLPLTAACKCYVKGWFQTSTQISSRV
jgi:hypothetical protein